MRLTQVRVLGVRRLRRVERDKIEAGTTMR
jgi:hypothetical protein